MSNKIRFFVFILNLVFFAFFVPSFSPLYAGECAHVEVYVMNLESGQGIPGASALLRCQNTFTAGGVSHSCTEEGAWYGNCWENSGWRNVPADGHLVFGTTEAGYDCFISNAKWELRIPAGWTWKCSTDGSKYDCRDGSNVDTNNLPVINGGSYVFKIFYSPPPRPTSTPTPTPRPTPTPTPRPTPTPTPRPTSTPTPTPTPRPTSTPTVCPIPNAVNNIRIECPYCR